MTLPTLLFGFLVASFLGAGFHLWKGGGLGRLLLYLVLAWVGFWGGYLLGNSIGLTFGSVGQLRMGMAVVAAAAVLYLGYWLSLINHEEPRR